MGLFDWIKNLTGGSDPYSVGRSSGSPYREGLDGNPSRDTGSESAKAKPGSRDLAELAVWLKTDLATLAAVKPNYRQFSINKRTGGSREIHAPYAQLQEMQRVILRRVLSGLKAHPAVHGFEANRSIATNAHAHTGKAIVVRMDIKNFFGSTASWRVEDYFRFVGWDKKAASQLTKLCTHKSSLPQGAPTSPRLSNLVNYLLDARLTGLAKSLSGSYTRYADDMTFSFHSKSRHAPQWAIYATKEILAYYGYHLHQKKKLRIMRQHDRQTITGLVVNQQVNLPRSLRRRLRAAEHQMRTRGTSSLTEKQLAGYRALENMIRTQTASSI